MARIRRSRKRWHVFRIMTQSTELTISAFLVCCNEELNIRRCLESLTWCDEIVVIDSGSTDRTLAIAREYTDRIFHRDWNGFVAQKRFGLEQCRGRWVLNVDADEEVSPELRSAIQLIVNDPAPGATGYELLRVVYFLGRWWRKGGWYPEYRLRLALRENTTWGGRDPHEHAVVSGRVDRLHAELRHYTYTDLQDQIRALNSHSSAAAKSLFDDGERSSWVRMFLNPIARVLKFYVLRKGYREGLAGFVVALLEGWYVFLKYAKLWELRQQAANNTPNDRINTL